MIPKTAYTRRTLPASLADLPDDIRLTLARACGFAVAAIGFVVVAAWILGIRGLIPIGSAIPGMAFNAALGVGLCGASAVLSLSRRRLFRSIGFYIAVAVALATTLPLIDRLFGDDRTLMSAPSGWLVSDIMLAEFHGGISPNTMVGVLAFCIVQIYLRFASARPSATILTAGGLIASGLGLSAMAGYLFGMEAAYSWRGFAGMAPQSAVAVWLLGMVLLLLARHPAYRRSTPLPFVVAVLATAFGLFFDLATPPYLGANFVYIPVVLTGAWFADRRMAFSLAVVCALFVILGYAAKVQFADMEQQRLIGRVLGVGTLFIVATLIYFFRLEGERNERARLRFEAMMDNSPDAVVTIDSLGTVLQFNPAAERMFRYSESQVVGQNIKLLMPEPYHSAHDGYLRHHMETGEAHIIGTIREVSGRRSDNATFPLDLSVSVLPSEGAPEFLGVLRDLSARKRQEDNLRETLGQLAAYAADLERSNKELDDFAYIASHDLKEPLRGIHNHSRFLLEDYETLLDDDGKRRLGRLVNLSQRMEKLVNDLLYFSRIGRQELAIKETDLDAVITDVCATLDQLIEERHARVHVVGHMPSIVCDSVRVTEIFRNLVVNAIKYNDKGEKLVEVGCLESHADETGKLRNQVFFVRDNGKGIAPEFHQDIFRMFKRLERAEEGDTGTGAGLTFVRKIVQRHGGHIWLESEPGRGTTFFFTLTPE